MNTEVVTTDKIKVAIKSAVFQEALRSQLPSNITADKFTNTALAALSNNPDLLKCDRQSLYDAITKAAQQGLLPNGQEGAIVPFKGKATWMPMVAGIIKRLGESKIFLEAQVVAENDYFEQQFGDAPAISHKPPKLGQDRGAFVGVYAIARLPNGLVMREVMDKGQVDAVAAKSRTNRDDRPWDEFYGEMARKTCIRRLAKRLPLIDPHTENAIKAVDELYDFTDNLPAPANEPVVVTQSQPEKARPKALQAVVDTVKKAEPVVVTQPVTAPVVETVVEEGEVF